MEENGTTKSITAGEFFANLKAHIVFILATTLCITVIGAIYAFAFKKTSYTAGATLQVYVNADESNIAETTAYSFGTYLAEDYMKVLKYPAYIQNAAEKGVKINADGLKFSHEEKSILLEVTYTVKSKQDIRAKVADDLNKYLEYTKEAIDNGEKTAYSDRLNIESEASADTVVAKRGALKTVVIAFLAGLLLSVAIITIKFFADDKFKSKAEVEDITGATVLATVTFSDDAKKEAKQKARG